MTRSSNSSKQFFAIAWYTPEQWRLLKRKAVDAHLLDSSYQQWLEEAEKLIARLQQENKAFAKCFVDVEELEKWRHDKGLPLDGAAGSRFVAELARMQHEQRTRDARLGRQKIKGSSGAFDIAPGRLNEKRAIPSPGNG